MDLAQSQRAFDGRSGGNNRQEMQQKAEELRSKMQACMTLHLETISDTLMLDQKRAKEVSQIQQELQQEMRANRSMDRSTLRKMMRENPQKLLQEQQNEITPSIENDINR